MLVSSRNGFIYIATVMGLAAINFAGASLGKLLAIPPGNITPLWPPSGIAFTVLFLLGKRYWPGVLLGSFCFNSAFCYEQHHLFSLHDFFSSLGIAIGSTVQALVGVELVNRLTGEKSSDWPLDTFLKALLRAGPIACIIAATIGVGVLWLAGSIPLKDTLSIWITWWFGDTTGVLLLGGLILAMNRHCHGHIIEKVTSKIQLQRLLSVALLFL